MDDDGMQRPLRPSEARLIYVAVTRAREHLDPAGITWIDGYENAAAQAAADGTVGGRPMIALNLTLQLKYPLALISLQQVRDPQPAWRAATAMHPEIRTGLDAAQVLGGLAVLAGVAGFQLVTAAKAQQRGWLGEIEGLRVSKSASPAPTTNSPSSTPNWPTTTRKSTSDCPPSPTSPPAQATPRSRHH